MLMRFSWLFFIFFMLSLASFGQSDSTTLSTDSVVLKTKNDTRFDDGRLLYRYNISGVFTAHTSGWGFHIRKARNLNLFQKLFWNIEFSTMKHPKEYKISPFEGDAKSYVFGKKNNLSILRGTYGYQKMLFEKEEFKGVQIGVNFAGGFTMGLAKPVYLEIQYPYVSGANTLSVFEAYDETKHSQIQIRGRAPFVYGINEIKIYPGLHARAAINIEYSSVDNIIRAIETGIQVDAFYKKVPIMAFADNKQFFINLFISWQFGKKYSS